MIVLRMSLREYFKMVHFFKFVCKRSGNFCAQSHHGLKNAFQKIPNDLEIVLSCLRKCTARVSKMSADVAVRF